MDDELDTLRQMARSPQHYSNYALSAALHTALDRLDDANAETLRLASALAGVREHSQQYKAALEQIAGYPIGADWSAAEAMQKMARAALPPGGGDTNER